MLSASAYTCNLNMFGYDSPTCLVMSGTWMVITAVEGGADEEWSWEGGLLGSPYQLADKRGERGKLWGNACVSLGRRNGNPPVSVPLYALDTALLEHASSTPVDLSAGFVAQRVVLFFGFLFK